jgi:hypothetical protein
MAHQWQEQRYEQKLKKLPLLNFGISHKAKLCGRYSQDGTAPNSNLRETFIVTGNDPEFPVILA